MLASLLELPETGRLPVARYTRSGFAPRITFDVPDRGWAAAQVYPGFFDIQRDQDTPDVIAVQFTTIEGAFGADPEPVAVSTAAAAIAALRANPALTVVDAAPASIDGNHGEAITVDAAGGRDADLVRTPPGVLSMIPGRRLRLLLFDSRAGVLGILVGGSIAQWSRAEAAAQPVLDSIAIGP